MIARKLRQLKPKGFVFLTLIIGIVYLAKDIIYPSYESLTNEDKEVQTEYVSVGYIQKSKEDNMRKEINQTNEEKLSIMMIENHYEDDDTRNNHRTEVNRENLDHKKTLSNNLNKTLLGKTNKRFSHSEATSDYDIKTILSTMKLQQSDGGQFTPMWDLRLKRNTKERLEVIIVPHSHNDPGWLETFDWYYQQKTRKTLDLLVENLFKHEDLTFIWAEVIFFAAWWDEQGLHTKEKVKTIVARGQLEFVLGGWTMNDEAVTHYYGIIEQMTTGHQWLWQTLKVRPKSGWAIDVFGASPTMGYVYSKMEMTGMVIHRIHYNIKHFLGVKRALQFQWVQGWHQNYDPDILTHVLPYTSYEPTRSCGPDYKVCCKFDFSRLVKNGWPCVDGDPALGGDMTGDMIPVKKINKGNIKQLSKELVMQYKKTAQLYRTNVLLVPLGDDFSWSNRKEWELQVKNYKALMKFINKKFKSLNIKFGTLDEYFNKIKSQKSVSEFPKISGNFFTYADRHEDYWSGFYSLRPFWKRMGRELESYLRNAEIMLVLYSTQGNGQSECARMLAKIQSSRKSLSLFQHHDAITGTCRSDVVKNYAETMLGSFDDLGQIMEEIVSIIMYKGLLEDLHITPRRTSYNTPPVHIKYETEDLEEQTVIIFNSASRKRFSKIEVGIQDIERQETVVVTCNGNVEKKFDVKNIESNSPETDDTHNKVLIFPLSLQPLSFTVCSIVTTKVRDKRDAEQVGDVEGSIIDEDEPVEKANANILENRNFVLKFSENGFLTSIYNKEEGWRQYISLGFHMYTGTESGPYLLRNIGNREEVGGFGDPIMTKGSVCSSIQVKSDLVTHKLTLCDDAIEIENTVDVTQADSTEVLMEIRTDIKSGNKSFTDLNSFQISERIHRPDLPKQANFYPMSSMAYIQDIDGRLTLLSNLPLGISNPSSGVLEVLLDRSASHDDGRGLAGSLSSEVKSSSRFLLVLETRKPNCIDLATLPTLKSLTARSDLLHPPVVFVGGNYEQNVRNASASFLNNPPPPQVEIVNLRMESDIISSKLMIHNQGYHDCFGDHDNDRGDVTFQVEDMFPGMFKHVSETSMDGVTDGEPKDTSSSLVVRGMEIESFKLVRKLPGS